MGALEVAGGGGKVGVRSVTGDASVAGGVYRNIEAKFVPAAAQICGVGEDGINNKGLAAVVFGNLKRNAALSLEHVARCNFLLLAVHLSINTAVALQLDLSFLGVEHQITRGV